MTGVQTVPAPPPATARKAAKELVDTSGRRDEIPIRKSFVRVDAPDETPPLARLVSTRGRGGAVPVLLYLALIWRCAAPPFSTDIQARKWATLLGLADPDTRGARRITNALNVLERERLVALEKRRGEPTIVTILMESGDGRDYRLPSTATAKARTKPGEAKHWYFKVPATLWTTGQIQTMSAAAIAMLLILLCERNVDGRDTWWSTDRFPRLFSISSTMRAKGTSELRQRGLLQVSKQPVADGPDPTRIFTRDRVRNLYRLAGDARPADMRQAQAQRTKRKRKSGTRFVRKTTVAKTPKR